jgi:hypothetical protein
LGSFEYGGDPDTVAGDMVTRLIDSGTMPGEPDKQALGVLLQRIYLIRGLSQEHVNSIQEIWDTYGLKPPLSRPQ